MQEVKTLLATESYTELDDLTWVGCGDQSQLRKGKQDVSLS